MSTPENTDTPSFKEQVNDLVNKATVDDKGNLVLPEGVEASEEVQYAATLEKRHRDTQSSYTKSQQQVKVLKSENIKLAENWERAEVENLTSKEKSNLAELKTTDPDAYIEKVNELKQEAATKFQESRSKLTSDTTVEAELAHRESLLSSYNDENPKNPITQDVIDNDVPPRITKMLEKGEITFEQFLEKCKKYIETPRVIKGSDEEQYKEPDLGKAKGSGSPTEKDKRAQNSEDYNNQIF